jgi:hypothetical protein
LQPDPFVTDAYEGQSYNRYSYVKNDPANRTDPSGMADNAKLKQNYGNGGAGDSDAAAAGLGDTTPATLADGSKEIVIHGTPRDKSGDHLGTDSNGEGAAVQGAAALADTWYQGSSTDQGLNAGTGGGPNVGPTGLCGGCSEKDAFSYFYEYGGYVQSGLVYMAATATAIAAAAVVLPAMTIGGLATGGAGLLEGAAVATAPVATAATGAAAVAGTPTGQAIFEDVEKIAEGPFVNQLPEKLAAELKAAAAVGAGPISAGSEGFEDALNAGTIKWVVTQAGELIVSPHTVDGVEISHAVLSGGQAVLAAGQAEIAGAGGQFVGLSIEAWSGHFMPSAGSLSIGVDAFSRYGIQF